MFTGALLCPVYCVCRWTLHIRQLRDANFGVCLTEVCDGLVGSKVFLKLSNLSLLLDEHFWMKSDPYKCQAGKSITPYVVVCVWIFNDQQNGQQC